MAVAKTALQRVSDGRGPLKDWPILLLGAVLVGAFAFQLFVLRDRAVDYGISAKALREGRWWTLLTSMFIHAGLYHLTMNVSALSIGAPVYRRLGAGLKGTLLFFGLYFTCGLAGGLAYVALNPEGTTPAAGASGAIFGLWGALARIGPGDGEIYPLFSKAVGRHVWRAAKQNLALIAFLFVLGLLSRGAALKLAWEAHAGGFLAGLLLIASLLRLAGASPGKGAGEPTVIGET
jgi:membrane associated rhomboid family serine protease